MEILEWLQVDLKFIDQEMVSLPILFKKTVNEYKNNLKCNIVCLLRVIVIPMLILKNKDLL